MQLLNDVLDSGALPPRSRLGMVSDNATAHAANGLAIHLLGAMVEPAELQRELSAMDAVLADRLADQLLDGVDFDACDWTT